MMGVLVGFVGKPVGISGVSEDLSTVFDKDMMDVENFRGTSEGCWRGCRCLQTEYQSAQKVLVIDVCFDSRCGSVMQGV